MKQALLVVNVFLLVAVSYLLYKDFTRKDTVPSAAAAQAIDKDSLANKRILFAYINPDSIQNQYILAKEVSKEFERKSEALNNEISKMERAYKEKLEKYQEKAPTMTEEEMNAARQDMEVTQRQMVERKQALEEEFGQWIASRNVSVRKKIQEFLKKYNANGMYTFIFSHENFFYYSDPAYDITKEVIKGLNEEYKTASKKEK